MTWIRACDSVWIVIGIIWLATSFTTKPAVRKQPVAASLAYKVTVFLAGFLLFDSGFSVGVLGVSFRPPSVILDSAGFAITVCGAAFAVWARFFLGTNWSSAVSVKQNHQLIQSGPYAIVRHPIYAGFSLGALGTAIAVGEIRGLLAVVLSVLTWRMKWGVEEAFMKEQFGAQYVEYKRRVNALIPGIW
jgi:protein-S-isoprenylcysteine O-methyltransferase Ste14